MGQAHRLCRPCDQQIIFSAINAKSMLITDRQRACSDVQKLVMRASEDVKNKGAYKRYLKPSLSPQFRMIAGCFGRFSKTSN
jgi:hypothetical protein